MPLQGCPQAVLSKIEMKLAASGHCNWRESLGRELGVRPCSHKNLVAGEEIVNGQDILTYVCRFGSLPYLIKPNLMLLLLIDIHV